MSVVCLLIAAAGATAQGHDEIALTRAEVLTERRAIARVKQYLPPDPRPIDATKAANPFVAIENAGYKKVT